MIVGIVVAVFIITAAWIMVVLYMYFKFMSTNSTTKVTVLKTQRGESVNRPSMFAKQRESL